MVALVPDSKAPPVIHVSLKSDRKILKKLKFTL